MRQSSVKLHLTREYSWHYDDVIMGTIASQITSLTIVYSTVYSGADQSKHQSSASLAFVWGIHRGPVNSPRKWPVTRKMFPFDDVIMTLDSFRCILQVSFGNSAGVPQQSSISFSYYSIYNMYNPMRFRDTITMALHHSPWLSVYTVKPVYNDHLMGYFSAFYSSSRWPRAT